MGLIDAFLEQCEKTPDNIAVKYENQVISYRQLDDMSNALARHIKNKGVAVGDNVVIVMNRGIEMMIAIYAVLKSGAAYVPIDKMYPLERAKYIVEDVNASLIIADDDITWSFIKNVLFVSELKSIANNSNNVSFKNLSTDNSLSYIIYTSGTTGRPKGVMVEHRNVQNCMEWMKDELQITASDVFLQKTNYAFDVSMCEIFLPLQCGATLVMAKADGQKDVEYLARVIREEGVTTVFFVPSMLNLFLQADDIPCTSLKNVICSGEELTESTLRKFKNIYSSGVQIYNMYGPTETAVHVTYHNCTDIFIDSGEKVSIGRAPSSVEIFIVDENNNLVKQGTDGELCIGGIQVTRGYWHNEELTDKRFIVIKKNDGQLIRVYKTGDLCRMEETGYITYKGRIDSQVKLRGFRIELCEIENIILEDDNIKDAAVILKKNEDEFLVSFLTVRNQADFREVDLRERLALKLPAYMLPKYYVVVNSIPLGTTGKRDYKALQKMDYQIISKNYYYDSFTNDENYIADIISEIFNIQVTEKDKNTLFWKLGLDSFNLIKLKRMIFETRKIDIPLADIFLNCTIKKMANLLNIGGENKQANSIGCDLIPLNERLGNYIFTEQIKGGSCVYNLPKVLKFSGMLDKELLKKATEYVLNNMKSLKLKVVEKESEMFFKYEDNPIVVDIIYESVSVSTCIDQLLSNALNLNECNLKAYIIDGNDDILYLVLNIHHIVIDGWSNEIICREIVACYDKLLEGKEIEKSFEKFNLYESTKDISDEYWIKKFEDFSGPSAIVSTKSRKKIFSFMGSSKTLNLDDSTCELINEWCKSVSCSQSVLFMLAYIILISKYTNKKDVTIGIPYNGRDTATVFEAVGNFVKMLPIRLRFSSDTLLSNLIVELSQELQNSISHSDFSQQKIAEHLGLTRDTSRNLLYQLGFAFQKYPEYSTEYNNFSVESIHVHNHSAMMDLVLYVHQICGDRYALEIEYSDDLYEKDFINQIFNNYIFILNQIVTDLQRPIGQIRAVCDAELCRINRVLEKKEPVGLINSLSEIIDNQIKLKSKKIAVNSNGKMHTYQELDMRANSIALELDKFGVNINDRVCLYCKKDFNYIAAIVACMRLNAVFVPIDLNFPEKRVDFIISDSKCKVLLTDISLVNKNVRCIDLNDIEEKQQIIKTVNSDYTDQFYILYTSGTTGNPKGTLCKKSSVMNLLDDINKRASNHTDSIIGSLWTSVSFDVSIYEIFSILTQGGELVIVPETIRYIPTEYFKWLYENNINFTYIPPSMIVEFSEYVYCNENVPKIQRLLVGVEPIINGTLRKIADKISGIDIFNGYGPTETTICSTIFKYDGRNNEERVPIGNPIQNTSLYILDDDLNIMPMFVPGELYISGAGVSMGYINLEQENINGFINNPYAINKSNEIMYRTGDIVRLDKFEITFVGREDSQIKLNGYKVNLYEIADVIKNNLKGCLDSILELQDKKLVAFLKMDRGGVKNFSAVEVRKWLRSYLPLYMIPSKIYAVEDFPLTISGKIDKKQLMLISRSEKEETVSSNSNVIDEDEVITRIKHIWEEVLEIKIDYEMLDANFFDLGGNSMLLMKIYTSINNAFKTDISIIDLFEYTSIREIADYIKKKAINNNEDSMHISIKNQNNKRRDRLHKLRNHRV